MLQLKVASLFFFSGLAVVVALVVVVYFVAWVYDRASGASGAFLTPTELEERRVASTVVKEAGLAGLLADEKDKVMRHFFQENSSVYRKKQHDIESPQDELKAGKDDKDAKRHSKPRSDRCCEGTNCSCCEDSNYLDPESKNEESNVTRHKIFGVSGRHGKQKEREEVYEIESPENDEDKDHQDGVCPICLVEFGKNESQGSDKIVPKVVASNLAMFFLIKITIRKWRVRFERKFLWSHVPFGMLYAMGRKESYWLPTLPSWHDDCWKLFGISVWGFGRTASKQNETH